MKKFKKGQVVWIAGSKEREPVRAELLEAVGRNDAVVVVERSRDLKVIERDRLDVWASEYEALLVCRDNLVREVSKLQKKLCGCDLQIEFIRRFANQKEG